MTASRITDTLWVGDWQDAKAAAEIPGLLIITCAVDSPFVGKKKFDLVDGPAPNNAQIFMEAVNCVVWTQSSPGGPIPTLVHCVSGISRSCAVVAGCLMITDLETTDFDSALTKIRETRPVANPVQFFVDELRSWSGKRN